MHLIVGWNFLISFMTGLEVKGNETHTKKWPKDFILSVSASRMDDLTEAATNGQDN